MSMHAGVDGGHPALGTIPGKRIRNQKQYVNNNLPDSKKLYMSVISIDFFSLWFLPEYLLEVYNCPLLHYLIHIHVVRSELFVFLDVIFYVAFVWVGKTYGKLRSTQCNEFSI